MNWLELSLTLLAYDLHMKKCIILKVFCTGERKKGVKTQRGLCTAVLLLFRIFSECFFLCSSHWGDFCVYLNWIYILFFFLHIFYRKSQHNKNSNYLHCVLFELRWNCVFHTQMRVCVYVCSSLLKQIMVWTVNFAWILERKIGQNVSFSYERKLCDNGLTIIVDFLAHF